MTLELDKRQRAMLREMGVQVWSPLPAAPAPVATASAPQSVIAPAASPAAPSASAPLAPPAVAPARAAAAPVASARPAPATPAAAPNAAPAAPPRESDDAATGWQVGQALPVAGEGDPSAERGPRWLLLAEGRPDERADGAGPLLRNMLRAARLHQGAQVWLAPLQRQPQPPGVEGLDQVLGQVEPDVVFIMSRLGAQALLETQEPLGRLRGQVHDLWGVPAVVSYDLGTLLRTPTEKAKAWDDLCLALQVARAQHAERMAAE